MTIDKNVPLPISKWEQEQIDLDKLEVGDSFFIEDAISRVRSRVRNWLEKNPDINKKFSCRHWDEPGKLGSRVWRTK